MTKVPPLGTSPGIYKDSGACDSMMLENRPGSIIRLTYVIVFGVPRLLLGWVLRIGFLAVPRLLWMNALTAMI